MSEANADLNRALMNSEMEACASILRGAGATDVMILVVHKNDSNESESLSLFEGQRFQVIGAVSCWLHDELAKP